MKINFTPTQQKCIDTKDCSILVSAGAGSGKTAVLTERIVTRLIDQSDVLEADNFIAVTFTKAAAGELKERLYKKLCEYIAKNPHNKKAVRQLAKLGNAKVSTIHSFCLDLIKSNFTKLSLSPDMHIGDENENQLVLRRLLDDILEEMYDSKDSADSSFYELADTLSNYRDDEILSRTVLDLYPKLRKNPSIEACFDNAVLKYDEVLEKQEYFDSFYGKIAKEAIINTLDEAKDTLKKICLECLEYPETKNSYLPSFETDLKNVCNAREQIALGYLNTATHLADLKPTPVGRLVKFPYPEFSAKLRDSRSAVFKSISGTINKFFLATKDEINASALASKRIVLCLKDIVLKLDCEFTKYKHSRLVLDFNDLEKYALALLYDKDEKGVLTVSRLAKQLSEGIEEIYIDEYQDINPIQDLIFCAITKNGAEGEYNRFMVGDKKQSIYRFRGSEPEIFNNYSNTFYDADSNKAQRKIFLSHNFRCSENVINTVNALFCDIMGEDYPPEERLIYARNDQNYTPPPCELMITKPVPVTTDKNTLENSDRTEAEAYAIAQKIKEIVSNPLYTSKEGKNFCYGDITILLRSMKGSCDVFEKVLQKCGIPVKSERPESFFEKREVMLAVSFLQAFDNPERDIPLAAVLKSPVYNFSADELVKIKTPTKKQSLYTSLCVYEKEGKDIALKEKVSAFLQNLYDFSSCARNMPCDKFIKYFYSRTNFLQICSSKAFGCKTSQKSSEVYNSLTRLYSIAVNYSKDAYKGLFAFIDYVADLKKQQVCYEENVQDNADYVKIMSTHHSKGLEFPVCIVANLAKKFNTQDEKWFLLYDDKGGIGLKLKDSDDGFCSIDTPFRQALIELDNMALTKEEKRIFYVAATRAKDLLILSAGEKDPEKLLANCSKEKMESNSTDSPIKWILNSLNNSVVMKNVYEHFGIQKNCNDTALKENILKVEVKECAFSLKYSPKTVLNESKDTACDIYSQSDIKKALLYNYKNCALSKIPSKLTVSSLKIGLLDDKEDDGQSKVFETNTNTLFPQKPKFLTGAKSATPSEKGTAMHLFMQFAHYNLAKEKGAKAAAEDLLNRAFIDKPTYDMLDFEPLDTFFKGPLYEKIASSPFVKREMRFNLKLDASKIDNTVAPDTHFVLVQGVIDCFFENPDGTLTVVDFKTDRVSQQNGESTLISRHSAQLEYYCIAASKITGKPVSSAILYSFALNKEVFVDFNM